MDWLTEKIDNALKWFGDAIKAVFDAITTWLKDFFIWILDALLSGIASVFELIAVPDFLAQGLAPLFSSLPAPLVYLMAQTGFFEALAIVGGGVAFNLIRKAVTLGQW